MNTFNNLKTGVKLTGGFLFVAFIIVAVAVVGYFNMKSLATNTATMYHDRLVPIRQLSICKKIT